MPWQANPRGIQVGKPHGQLPRAALQAANLIVIAPFHENSYTPNIGGYMPEDDLFRQEIPDERRRQIRRYPDIPSRGCAG